MNGIASDFCEQMAVRMPEQLFLALKGHGLKVDISAVLKEKMQRYRQPTKHKPRWLQQFFSDRAESDDSEVSQHDDGDYGDEDDEDYYNDDDGEGQDDDDSEEQGCYGENDYEEDVRRKKAPKPKPRPKRGRREDVEDPPELLPTYSKIEEEMSGGELRREEVVKLL
jgi:hypothetical protein